MIKKLNLIVCFIFFLAFNLLAQNEKGTDRIILKNDKEITGTILDRNKKTVTILTEANDYEVYDLIYVSKFYQYIDDDNTLVWISEDPIIPEDMDLEDNGVIYPKEIKQSKNSSLQKLVKVREIGINVSSLISQFVPLGTSSTSTGPYNIIFRIGNQEDLFHIQLGMDSDETDGELNHFNAGFGYMRKTPINDKFIYYKFFNIMGFSGNFNDPNSSSVSSIFGPEGGAGLGIGLGIEYKLSSQVHLGTEAILYLGSPALDIIPPIGLYLIAHLER